MPKPKKPSVGRRVARPGKTTPVSEKMQIGLRRGLLSRRLLVSVLVIAGTAAVIGAILGLYFKLYADPTRVFNDMLRNNLATRGFTKEIVRQSGNGSSDETTQLIFTPNILVRDIRQIDSPATKTKYTVETVANPDADYSHYLKIASQNAAGQKLDYRSIYSLWIKNSISSGSQAQLVNSSFFGATLFGNLDPASRRQVVSRLKTAYVVDYDHIEKKTVDYRRSYSYNVVVLLRPYATAAHLYASYLGLPVANQISPGIYSKDAKLRLKLTVDVLSRQLRQVEYIDQGVTETYSGYGTAPDIALPTRTVSPEVLNQAINAIQQ